MIWGHKTMYFLLLYSLSGSFISQYVSLGQTFHKAEGMGEGTCVWLQSFYKKILSNSCVPGLAWP